MRSGWTAGTTRGRVGHLGLMHTKTRRGSWWTTAERRCIGSENCQATPQQPTQTRCANYWAALTNKRHPPQPAQPYTNDWAPRTRKRHQQEHRLQQPTKHSNPT